MPLAAPRIVSYTFSPFCNREEADSGDQCHVMTELREGTMGKHSRQRVQPVQRPWGSTGPGALEEQ